MKKSFVHTTRLSAEAKTTPAIIHRLREKKGVRYYEGVRYDADGTAVFGDEIEREKIQISRATTELSGAYPYIFNFLDYICTHAPDLINLKNDTTVYHYSVNAPWEKFLEITLGEYTDQKKLLQDELYRLMHETKPKIIPYGDGSSIYGYPFMVTLQSKNKKELSQKQIIKLQNIGQASTIGNIQIFFLKPLFFDVVEGRGKFINMPKGFHAMLVNKARQIAFMRTTDPELREFLNNGQSVGPLFDMDLSPHQVAAYMRLYYYICLHDNQKGSYITLSLPDMVSHVIPQYSELIGEKLYIRNKRAVEDFLTIGLSIFASLKTTSANFEVVGVETKNPADLKIKIKVNRRYKSKPDLPHDTLNIIKITLSDEPA